MSQADEIESILRARSLPVLDDLCPAGEFVMPNYDGLGIANLPSTIAALLGANLPGACPPLQQDLWADWTEDIKRVVLVVVDALGYLQLRAAMQADDDLVFHRLAQAGRMVPITSTFPSTTCTVLTTLWTGYPPAAHGSLAFELFLRELGVTASVLFFWPVRHRQRDQLFEWGLDPETFIPVPGIAEQFVAQGVRTHALIAKAYAASMMTKILQRGIQETRGFVGQGDMWLELQRAIARHCDDGHRDGKHRDRKLFLTLYCSTIDGMTHEYSPDDASWHLELRAMSRMMEEGFLSRLTPEQRDGTLLLITADHGGVSTLLHDAIQLDHHPDLGDALLFPPVGETRVPFMYARGDRLEFAKSYMAKLDHSFVTLTREQVLESGLLGPGPMYVETPHRLGDLIGIARGNHFLAQNEYHLKMKGRHGGLSPQEMLVPLIGVRLDAL
ncbi:MAG: alkaline phosphatase family protein [Anaerolineae bacterium]|nr:alkaline phosphatase family protein [Anaerolineae bacterium]